MMYRILHFLLVAFYLAAPPVAVMFDGLFSWRRARGTPSANLVMTLTASILLGTGLALIYAIGIGGHIPLLQIFLAIYFAAGLLIILKGFDAILKRLLRVAFSPLLRPTRAAITRRGSLAAAALCAPSCWSQSACHTSWQRS